MEVPSEISGSWVIGKSTDRALPGGTHIAVDIPDCKGIKELNIEPSDEDEGTGDLRYVQMAVTTYDTSLPASQRYTNGKVQVSLVWNARNEKSPNSEKMHALVNFFVEKVWAVEQCSFVSLYMD